MTSCCNIQVFDWCPLLSFSFIWPYRSTLLVIGALICIGCRNRLLELLVIPVYLIHLGRWNGSPDNLWLQRHHFPATDFEQIRNLKKTEGIAVFSCKVVKYFRSQSRYILTVSLFPWRISPCSLVMLFHINSGLNQNWIKVWIVLLFLNHSWQKKYNWKNIEVQRLKDFNWRHGMGFSNR